MAIEHVNITGANLHEPKGVAAAAANKVYVSDGAGSGSWSQIGTDQIDTSSIKNINERTITFKISDISTAGSDWVVIPWAGDIIKIYSVIDGAITGADCGLSFEISGTAITGGGITIANSSSAAGDVDSSTPSAANTVSAGQALEIISDGASTGTVSATLTFVIDIS